ncbi:type II toxin-antitoxin system Phd/YefM family antitoxin [Streptomyces sp. MBT67]|nr:type II toxin-antitoxin system Phd/YefM family antitoxin [Streptomyces sp. MBT67]MBK3582387.1 type II toxin-antitoxin system Phd/YefM family antitoxin [Streptomyces sp. MBT57]
MTDEVHITATKLRRDLGAVMDAVLKGQTVHVSRQGRPLAVLLPPDRFEQLHDEPFGAQFAKPPTESSDT